MHAQDGGLCRTRPPRWRLLAQGYSGDPIAMILNSDTLRNGTTPLGRCVFRAPSAYAFGGVHAHESVHLVIRAMFPQAKS